MILSVTKSVICFPFLFIVLTVCLYLFFVSWYCPKVWGFFVLFWESTIKFFSCFSLGVTEIIMSKFGGFFLYCSFLSCAWHQLRSIHKYLGRQGWGDYWGFLTRTSCCFHHPTVLLWTHAQLDSICHNAAWLSGLKWLTFRKITSYSNNNNNQKL